MKLKSYWNDMRKGDPVILTKDVYHRKDGTTYGGIYYESPGKMVAQKGMVGRFSAKSDVGILVQFNNGSGSVLGLVLDEHVIEKYKK